MNKYHLAQLNIADMAAPYESPVFADFVANLDRINHLADRTPGFVWRLQTEEGDATEIRYFGEQVLVNMSVWQDINALRDFVYRSAHTEIMRRRKEWFAAMRESHMVLWWVPAGRIPGLDEAKARLDRLRVDGPTSEAFTFARPFPPPGQSGDAVAPVLDTCPAT